MYLISLQCKIKLPIHSMTLVWKHTGQNRLFFFLNALSLRVLRGSTIFPARVFYVFNTLVKGTGFTPLSKLSHICRSPLSFSLFVVFVTLGTNCYSFTLHTLSAKLFWSVSVNVAAYHHRTIWHKTFSRAARARFQLRQQNNTDAQDVVMWTNPREEQFVFWTCL